MLETSGAHRSVLPGRSMLEPPGRAGPWVVQGPEMEGAVEMVISLKV